MRERLMYTHQPFLLLVNRAIELVEKYSFQSVADGLDHKNRAEY